MRLTKSDDWIFVTLKMACYGLSAMSLDVPMSLDDGKFFFMDHGFNYRTFVCSSDYRKIRLLVSTDYRNIRLLVSKIKSNRG